MRRRRRHHRSCACASAFCSTHTHTYTHSARVKKGNINNNNQRKRDCCYHKIVTTTTTASIVAITLIYFSFFSLRLLDSNQTNKTTYANTENDQPEQTLLRVTSTLRIHTHTTTIIFYSENGKSKDLLNKKWKRIELVT